MAKLKIYGVPQSRAARVIWMAEECGVPYELVRIGPGGARSAEHLAINPNGHVPVIDDDGFVLWESMAINLYLAKKYGKDLTPRNAAEEGEAVQWSFWVMTECEEKLLALIMHRFVLPEAQRDPKAIEAAAEGLKAPMAVLDAALKQKNGHLTGGRFTVADLNVASVFNWLALTRPEALGGAPALAAWLTACGDRPAAKAARAMT